MMCASADGLSRVYESTVVRSCASSLPVREVVSGYREGGLCGFPVKEIDSYRPSPRYLECRGRDFSKYNRDGAKRSLRLCVAVSRSGDMCGLCMRGFGTQVNATDGHSHRAPRRESCDIDILGAREASSVFVLHAPYRVTYA